MFAASSLGYFGIFLDQHTIVFKPLTLSRYCASLPTLSRIVMITNGCCRKRSEKLLPKQRQSVLAEQKVVTLDQPSGRLGASFSTGGEPGDSVFRRLPADRFTEARRTQFLRCGAADRIRGNCYGRWIAGRTTPDLDRRGVLVQVESMPTSARSAAGMPRSDEERARGGTNITPVA